MAARDTQIDKLKAAATYLRQRNTQDALPQGFRLQQVTVHILNDEDNPENGYAEAVFTWQTDREQYDFTVSP